MKHVAIGRSDVLRGQYNMADIDVFDPNNICWYLSMKVDLTDKT